MCVCVCVCVCLVSNLEIRGWYPETSRTLAARLRCFPNHSSPPCVDLMPRSSARACARARPSVLWTLEAIRLVPNSQNGCHFVRPIPFRARRSCCESARPTTSCAQTFQNLADHGMTKVCCMIRDGDRIPPSSFPPPVPPSFSAPNVHILGLFLPRGLKGF